MESRQELFLRKVMRQYGTNPSLVVNGKLYYNLCNDCRMVVKVGTTDDYDGVIVEIINKVSFVSVKEIFRLENYCSDLDYNTFKTMIGYIIREKYESEKLSDYMSYINLSMLYRDINTYIDVFKC